MSFAANETSPSVPQKLTRSPTPYPRKLLQQQKKARVSEIEEASDEEKTPARLRRTPTPHPRKTSGAPAEEETSTCLKRTPTPHPKNAGVVLPPADEDEEGDRSEEQANSSVAVVETAGKYVPSPSEYVAGALFSLSLLSLSSRV
jgi:hypothetical protein